MPRPTAPRSPANQATTPPPDVVALLEGWSSRGHGSLARRLAHALRQLIYAGALPNGSRLPPERALAARIAVGRTTVTKAFDELRSDGHLVSTQGSGTFVVGPDAPVPVGTRVAEHLLSGPGIDLAKGDAPDLSHLPPIGLEMWQLNAAFGGAAIGVTGLPAVREAIAALYERGGVIGPPRSTTVDEIHVTAGSHQATHLLVSTLARRGDAVAVAELSYPGIFDLFDSCGVRAAPVRVDSAGLVPESLATVLARDRPAVLYFQAGPLIPTGGVTSGSRLRTIAHLLDAHDTALVEDTTVAALGSSDVAPTLSHLCRTTTTASTGSLSKICFTGMRLGWIRASAALIDAVVYRHLGWDLGASIPSQLLALQLLPHLDDIAEQRRHWLQRAVTSACEQLATAIPEATVTRPAGGSVLWIRFPTADSTALLDRARDRGVRVAPHGIHAADKQPGPYVRVDVDRPPSVVREGIVRLALAWEDLGR